MYSNDDRSSFLGVLHKFTVFDTAINLQEAIDEVRHLSPDGIVIYEHMLSLDLDPPLSKAIRRLISRSRFRLQLHRLFGFGKN